MLTVTFTGWATAALLLSLRLGPLFVFAPPFSQLRVPVRIRVCLVLALAGALATPMPVPLRDTPSALFTGVLSELALGLALAFPFQAAFAALSFAGRALDVQAGFGLATVIDPGSRGQAPLFGTLLTLGAGAVCFASGAHLELLRLVVASVERMPPGTARVVASPQAFIGYFGTVMSIGIGAVAAVMLALFLIDLSIAFLSRTLPQLNALMLGLQVKAIAAIVATALSIGLLAPIALRLLRKALEFAPASGAF
ncbi:TPA: flagellar biosynthetic protein FliR [Burkholderia cenocepacia]|uniref:flagellar biosynthetic protein FliR n=1 Tax=unclassified Burkholderia TaxID=2613784 RepID=UPI00158F309C|nr:MULTISPECIES: flagellar biosynthetic protein FliR [unclassified Burkholderia]HEF5875126.1 flagellar biosynthetic protein FliR [Burkholderia cenocepacia]